MSDLCGKCSGSGLKPGRFMSPCDSLPCPMCNGRGYGGRAAGIPPERYAEWVCGEWEPDGLDGARRRVDDNLGEVFG